MYEQWPGNVFLSVIIRSLPSLGTCSGVRLSSLPPVPLLGQMEVSRRSWGLSKSPAVEQRWVRPGRFSVPPFQHDTLKVKAVAGRHPGPIGLTRSASTSDGKSYGWQRAGGAAGALTTVWFPHEDTFFRSCHGKPLPSTFTWNYSSAFS